jgi:uncharacterized protein YuzE
MKIEYDPEADSAYIWLNDLESHAKNYSNEIWPMELNNEIGILFTADKKIMGFEVINASKYLDV